MSGCPRKLRDLLEDRLTGEDIDALVEAIRSPADDLRTKASELESRADTLDQVGSSLEALSDAVAATLECIDEYENAGGGEDRRDARVALFEAIGRVVETFDEADAHEVEELDVDLDMDQLREDKLPYNEQTPYIARVDWKDGIPHLVDQNGFDILPPEDRDEGVLPLREEVPPK